MSWPGIHKTGTSILRNSQDSWYEFRQIFKQDPDSNVCWGNDFYFGNLQTISLERYSVQNQMSQVQGKLGLSEGFRVRPPADNRAQRGAVVFPTAECWYLSSPDPSTWITRQSEMHCKFQWQGTKIWVFCMAKLPYSNNSHWLWCEHYLVSSLWAVISPTFQRCRFKKTDSRWAWGQAIWFSIQAVTYSKAAPGWMTDSSVKGRC